MAGSHREYFNSKAPVWDSLLKEETLARLKEFVAGLAIKPGSTVLDVGTGTGVLLPFLAAATGPGGKVVALDIAEEMLARAKSKNTAGNVTFVHGDITETPFCPGTFDEIICNSCFPHIVDRPRAVREMARILKPGGRLVIFHPQSREAVNEIHRSLGGVVANDLLPEDAAMLALLQENGFPAVALSSTPEKYQVTAYKPRNPERPELHFVGVIHSPYRTPDEAPHQGRFSERTAELEVFPDFEAGLKDVEAATHLIVLYWCHKACRDTLQTKTPFGPEIRGVFACRSPSRPNPIAFCVAELLERKGNRLLVKGVEAVDGSPLVDIKPYSSKLDSVSGAKIGWLSGQ